MMEREELIEHAKQDARRAMGAAKAQFEKAQLRVNQYMKDNPVRAAMIAAGIGAALGAAITLALTRKGRGRRD